MLYNIKVVGTGFYVEKVNDPKTPRFFNCHILLGINQNLDLKIYTSREEQDFSFGFEEIESITDKNGNVVVCENIKDVFIFLVKNLCAGNEQVLTINNMIPTPELFLNNVRGADAPSNPRILKVFFRETQNVDFLNKNPKIILERYKRRRKSKKNFNYKTFKEFVYTKKGFVHPQNGQINPETNIEIKSVWDCPQPNEYLEIDIQSVFVGVFMKSNLYPRGQGSTSKTLGTTRKPPRFQYFRFRIEITENGKKYLSNPSQVFAIGGNWLNALKVESQRVLQIFFK